MSFDEYAKKETPTVWLASLDCLLFVSYSYDCLCGKVIAALVAVIGLDNLSVDGSSHCCSAQGTSQKSSHDAS